MSYSNQNDIILIRKSEKRTNKHNNLSLSSGVSLTSYDTNSDNTSDAGLISSSGSASSSFIDDCSVNPMNRYIKSLSNTDIILKPSHYSNLNRSTSSENETQNEPRPDKKKLLNKTIKNKLNDGKCFNPPYNSSWFETENNLSLEQYINLLFSIVKNNFKCNVEKNTTKAIIVPHAGIRYSGLCSASAYYELYNRTKPIKRIILLCSNHTYNSDTNLNIYSTNYTNIKSYKGSTPLKIDTKLRENLAKYITIDDNIFSNEHSFSNQLPFIETVAPNALIFPLIIGQLIFNKRNNENLCMILNILVQVLKDKDTILICTSDLSHVNGDFDYKIENYLMQNIRKLDSEILQRIYDIIDGGTIGKKSIKKLDDILFMNNYPACGLPALYIFGNLMKKLSKMDGYSSSSNSSSDSASSNNSDNLIIMNKTFYPRITSYYNSIIRSKFDLFNFNKNDLISTLELPNNPDIGSVSYAGIIFTTQPYYQSRKLRQIENICTEYEKIALLGIAREQLFSKLYTIGRTGSSTNNNYIPSDLIRPINSPVFQLHLGVFTTLYIRKGEDLELRGCVGTLETNNDEITIIDNVKKYIIETAFNDNRFNPVEMKEFNALEYNITILNKLKPIGYEEFMWKEIFQLGRDGLLIKRNNKQGYFLPSVAIDLKLDKIKEKTEAKTILLQELCANKLKNNSKECYSKGNTELFYNEGISFSTS